MAADQVKVDVSNVSTVVPAVPTMKHRMFLSTFDLGALLVSNFRMLLFYKTEQEFSTIVENLKRSLSLVLVDFYPFAGRLDLQGGESGRPVIDCNDGGVEFVEASVNMAFEHLENNDFQQKPFFNQFVQARHPHYDTSLLSIQVTSFVRCGICIGVNAHHVVADGASFWHFLKCWAECSRGLPISQKPQHMRTVFKRDNVIPYISLKVKPVLTDRSTEAHIFTLVRDDSLLAAHSSNLADVPGRSLKTERSRASSSLVAVSAHFWRSVMKARQVPEKEPVFFEMVADGRDRVKPPLPPTYFGNCISMGMGRTTAEQLFEQDVGFAAALIQEIINSCTTEEHINNQIDHGFGSPSNVQEAFMNLCNLIGAMLLLPGRDGKSICVSTQLPHHQMETLKRILMVIPD